MLISAEIAESDPNFRNCPQYRKSQLFLNYLFADPSLDAIKGKNYPPNTEWPNDIYCEFMEIVMEY